MKLFWSRPALISTENGNLGGWSTRLSVHYRRMYPPSDAYDLASHAENGRRITGTFRFRFSFEIEI